MTSNNTSVPIPSYPQQTLDSPNVLYEIPIFNYNHPIFKMSIKKVSTNKLYHKSEPQQKLSLTWGTLQRSSFQRPASVHLGKKTMASPKEL